MQYWMNWIANTIQCKTTILRMFETFNSVNIYISSLTLKQLDDALTAFSTKITQMCATLNYIEKFFEISNNNCMHWSEHKNSKHIDMIDWLVFNGTSTQKGQFVPLGNRYNCALIHRGTSHLKAPGLTTSFVQKDTIDTTVPSFTVTLVTWKHLVSQPAWYRKTNQLEEVAMSRITTQ